MMDDLAAALMVAIRAHARQVDKLGEPYLLHVLRVVEAVRDEAKPLAALHDVVEDAGTHLEGARAASETGANYWDLMTLTRSETGACELHDGGDDPQRPSYADYILHIATCGGPLAREVKLADLRDNLSRIPTEQEYNRQMHDELSHVVSSWPEWHHVWGSLQARYEKAIATLEAPVEVPDG